MRPDTSTLSLLLLSSLSLAVPALAADAPAPSDAAPYGVEALPPAAVPAPRLVRSVEAQARTGSRDSGDESPASSQIAAEIEQETADMEDILRAEESSHVRDTPEAAIQQAVPGAGPAVEPSTGVSVEGGLVHQPGGSGRIDSLPELDHDLATLQSEYDIPIDVNPAVVAYVRFFQSPAVRPHFVKWLGRSHRYLEHYRQIMKDEGLPQDTVYLAMIESGFGNFAYSRARASGPWQFIASTGRIFGLNQDFWVDERRDPERSAHAAARFLKRLYEQTGDWRLAWAAYNAGAGRVLSAQRKGYEDFWSMAATKGRHVLRSETKGYVPKLMAAAIVAKHPEAFGFKAEEIERESWTDYAEVEVPSATLLSVVARAAGVPERDLVDLNPELRRACTPPRGYQVKVPVAAAQVFAEAWPAISTTVRTTFAGHLIRKGDTLSSVAGRYGVPVQGIVEMNRLGDSRRLRVGTELIIPRPLGRGAAVAAASEETPPAREAPRARPAAAKPVAPAPAPVVASVPARGDRKVLEVQSGDTLWSISQRYGVELTDLCRWNGIKSPRRHKLLSGSRLVVYADRG
jgi:membrane-bound lytic murein transglycosylase D